MVATSLTPLPAPFVTNAGAPWSGRRSPSSPPPVLPSQAAAPLRSRCSSSPSCRIGRGSGRGGPRARHARASARSRRRQTRRRGTRTRLLYPAPSPNPVAEVLEEALELGMLSGDAGLLPPPDALAVAAMSLSTLSRAVVWVQISRGRRRRCRKGMGATSLNRRLLALLLTSRVTLMMILSRILCICVGSWYVLGHASGQRKKSNLKKCREELQLRVAGWFRGRAGWAWPRGCQGRLLGTGDLADGCDASRAGSCAPAISLTDSTPRAATISDGDRAGRRRSGAVPRGRRAGRRRCWAAVSGAVVTQGRQAWGANFVEFLY